MDEKLARHLLDEELRKEGQGHATEGEWHGVRSLSSIQEIAEFGPTPEEDVAGEAAHLICLVREMAASNLRPPRGSITRRSDPLSLPEWWEMESQRRLDVFREERVWMRVDAGLFDAPKNTSDNFLYELRVAAPDDAVEGREPYVPLGSVAEIAPRVHDMIRRQHERFRSSAEEPPWGWDPDNILEYQVEIEFPADTWERDGSTERVAFLPAGFAAVTWGFVGEDWAGLDRLHSRSLWIAKALGITQAECLVWGLTNFPFTIPWMPTVVRSEWTPDDWSTVTIQVNSMSATAQEVARAYTRARGESDGQNATRRAPGPWPPFMAAFVQARSRVAPDETWDERFRTFASAYPDQPYRSMRTFRQTYYKQKRKERSDKGGSHDDTI